MEDLDSLLEDLGRGKSSTTSSSSASKQSRPSSARPVSSRVDLNELEDLMEDLAAPTAKKTPEPTPVTSFLSTPSSSSAPPPKSNGTSASSSHSSVSSVSAPTTATSSPSSSGSNVDDLEALMESLNVASNNRSSRRQSAKPVSVSPVAPAPVAATPQSPPPVPKVDPVPVSPPVVARAPPQQNYSAPATSGGAAIKGDDLDKLLNNLTSQMESVDNENPASRGTCNTCKGPILGEIIQALGRAYHPEHFVCGNCREPLGTKNFYEQNGMPHCQNCFETLFCPKCAYCNGSILDRCVTAIGKKWHPEHFICTQCLQPFPNGNFYERDGRPYCENDFYALFAPKCAACHDPIKGDCINALGQQWHPEHFVCTYCGKHFQGSFFEHNGKPFCEAHYHQQTGSLCAGCGKPITGRCVNALDKKWHPEHFVCAFCMNPLAGGAFSEKNNKAYCKECHGKLFGS